MVDIKLAVAEKFGRLDILINCAGVIFAGTTTTTYPQDWDYLTDIHIRTPFVLTQLFLGFLKKTNGVIINVSCDKGSRPEANLSGYAMCKAGIEMFTKSSAMELAPFGIRVNCVAPTMIDTNMYRLTGMTEPEIDSLNNRAIKHIPVQRLATCPEVAKAIIYLTSEHSKKITGHIMRVDGGKALTSKGQQDWYGSRYMNRKFE